MTKASNAALVEHGEAIIKSAINWTMHDRRATGDADHGFTFGRSGTIIRHVSPPIFDKRTGKVTGGHVTDERGKPSSFEGFNPLEDVYKDVRRRVQRAFQPWFDLGDPAGFKRQATYVEEATRLLSYRATTERGDVVGANVFNGNHVLRNMTQVQSKLTNYSGDAINAFTEKYTSQFPDVVAGQAALAIVLGCALEAEQKLWENATRDLVGIAKTVRASMHNEHQGDSNGGVGLTLAITASFAAIGTAFGGPVAGKVASAALGSASRFVPAGDNVPLHPKFGGTSPDQVLDKLEAALHDLAVSIRAHEQGIDRAMEAVLHQIDVRRNDFDLTTPRKLLGSTSLIDMGVRSKDPEIKVDPTDMADMGKRLLPHVADQFLKASHQLTLAIDDGMWVRSKRIGPGVSGAEHSWRRLNDVLRQILDDTKWELVKAGKALQIAARVLEDSDEEVRRALARQARKVEGGSPASHKTYSTSPA